MQRVGIILLLTFLCAHSKAQLAVDQQRHIDSIKREMAGAKSDSARARHAFELSFQFSYTDSIKARTYLKQAQKLIRNDNFLNALYYYYYAGYIYDLNPKAAMENYLLANQKLSAFDSKEAYLYRARSWRNYATLQQRMSNDSGMLKSITSYAIPLAKKAGNKEMEGELHTLIGLIYMNKHIYDKAIQQYKKGIAIIKSSNKKSSKLLDPYDNLARAYCFSDSFPQAEQALNEMRTLLDGHLESPYALSLYDTESIYFRKLKRYAQAINSINRGIILANAFNDSLKISSLQFNKYKILFEQGKYGQAKNVLQTVIKGPGSRLTENKIMYYHELSETYAKLNDMPNAYKWLKNFFVLWDSAYVEKMRTNIVDIENKYQRSEKEKEIIQLQNLNALEQKQKKFNKLIYFSTIVILLSAITLTTLQLRNKKRKEQLLKSQLKEMEQEKKISNYEALINGQEKERNRLATELHDGLGGMLAAVKMNLSNTAKDVENINAVIQNSMTKLDHSINELRLIARNLMPPSLQKLGLVNALKDFCEGVKTDDFNLIFQAYDIKEEAIDENTKLTIYRIFQELITNAIKHSKGSEILADLVQFDNQIQITVEDNGQGYDMRSEHQSGIGLANIKSRVNYLKGTMNVESNFHAGTSMTINFDLADANE